MVDTRSTTARQLRTLAATLKDRPSVDKKRKATLVVELPNKRAKTLVRAPEAKAAVSPLLIKSSHAASTRNATAKRRNATLSSPRKRTRTTGGGRRVADSLAATAPKRALRSSGIDVSRPSGSDQGRRTQPVQEAVRGLKRKHDDSDEPSRIDVNRPSGSGQSRQKRPRQEAVRESKRKREDSDEPSGIDVNRSSGPGPSRQTRPMQEAIRESKRKRSNSDEPTYDLPTASSSKEEDLLIEDLQAQLASVNRKIQIQRGEIETLRSMKAEKDAKFKLWEQKLFEREHEMLSKERTVQLREDELDEREIAVATQEGASHAEIARAERIVNLLEDKFTCALCYDIMAQPYQLLSPRCGHSFCASCLIEWALSQLHGECGHWHEAMECPLCRSTLPEAPYEVPREELSCPFAPNRIASDLLTGRLDELFAFLADTEVNDEPDALHSKKGKSKGVKRRRITYDDEDPAVAAWREGGDTRTSWQRRDRIGRQYMSTFIAKWSTFTPRDFMKFKKKFAQECAKK